MPEQAPPIRVMVVEDEPLSREGLRLLLQMDPEVHLCGEAQDGRQAVSLIQSLRPDLLFLDVQMPELDGFGVLRALPAVCIPGVIFVTAFDKYALRAFEVHAVDYLLKPFDDERFHDALRRAKEHFRLHRLSLLSERILGLLEMPTPPLQGWLQRLAIKDVGRVVFLSVQEIDWIEAADYYVEVHAGGRCYLHRESMHRLLTQLDPQRFVRIHRSAIVNWDRVVEVRHQGREMTVVLKGGAELKVARSQRDKVQQLR